MIISDSLGFLGVPGGPVVIDPELNLNLVHLTAAPPWADTPEKVYEEIEKFKVDISKHERLQVLYSGSELDDIISANKTAVVLGLQHVPEGTDPKLLKKLGIRIVIPSYEGWKNHAGLTNEGRMFITSCELFNICIDISHTSHEMARDILDFSKMAEIKIPVIASHTGRYKLHSIKRNLPDDILKQIAEQGGIVGIYAMSFFLSGKNDKSLSPMTQHLNLAINLCGIDNVCIGSDIPYLCRNEEGWKEDFKKLQAKLDPDGKMGSSWPDYPKELNCVDKASVLENMISNIVMSTPEGQRVTEKVVGKNFYNFVKENL